MYNKVESLVDDYNRNVSYKLSKEYLYFSPLSTVFTLLIGGLLLLVVYLIGKPAQLLDHMWYTIVMLHVGGLATYLFNRIVKDRLFIQKLGLNFPIKISISYDIVLFFATSALGQAAFFALYLRNYLSLAFIITYGSIAVVTTIGLVIARQLSQFPLPKGRILPNAILIFLVYTYGGFLYPHQSIFVQYLCNTVLLVVFFNAKVYVIDMFEKIGVDAVKKMCAMFLCFYRYQPLLSSLY